MRRLNELGYHENQNLIWDYRSAEGNAELLPRLAADLVALNPEVLIAGLGTLAPKALAGATRSIPIVFTAVGDAVGAGLIKSLSAPGGNLTGMTGLAADVVPKRLQLLSELIPGKRLVAVLGNPGTPYTALALEQLRLAATASGMQFRVFGARTVDEVSGAIFEAVEAGAAGMLVLEDPVLIEARQKIISRVAEARLPTISGPRDYATAGGLIAYGSDYHDLSRRAADYVDKILKGASPASLPVEQPTKLELLINLKAAREMGFIIPPALLASADEVIE